MSNQLPTIIVETRGGVVQSVAVSEGHKVNVIVVDWDEEETEGSSVKDRAIEGNYENTSWELLGRCSSFNVIK